jgi:nifR3 family TIM-barrel protein
MLVIGSLRLDAPFVQAALRGYSDLPMRRIARRFGVPYAFSEVVVDRMVVQKGRTRRRVLHVEPDDHPVGGQLMGADPPDFALAAADMVEAGYDAIDINFGCPVKKVLGRCRGGFLLSRPDVALDIVRAVLDAVGGRRPVTVKLRRGMDDSPESEGNFFTVLDGAFEAGVAAVTVHPRTVRQRYSGSADWAFLGRVKRHAGDRVVLGSGDLFSAEACLRMMAETGVDGVSIARGCIGNPWIFRECRALYGGEPLPAPPTVPDIGRALAAHYDEAVRVHGEAVACRTMRKFGIRYGSLHPQAREVRDAFVALRTSEEYRAVLGRWFSPDVDWPPVCRRTDHGRDIPADVSRGGYPGSAD